MILLKDSFDEQWDFEKEVVCDTRILLPNLVNLGWKMNCLLWIFWMTGSGDIFCQSVMHAHWSTAPTHMPYAPLFLRFVSCVILREIHFISYSSPFFKWFYPSRLYAVFPLPVSHQRTESIYKSHTNSFFAFLLHLFDNFLSPVWFMIVLLLFIF